MNVLRSVEAIVALICIVCAYGSYMIFQASNGKKVSLLHAAMLVLLIVVAISVQIALHLK